MQSVCKVRSRLEGFLGRFFWLLLVFWLQPSAAQASAAAQDITRLHEASRGLMASPEAPQRPGVRRAPLELHSQAAALLARGLKGFCGFCAGSVGPRHSPPYSSSERPTGIHWRQERPHPQRESGAIRSQRTGESADDAAAPAQTLRLVQRHKYQRIHWSRRHEDRD